MEKLILSREQVRRCDAAAIERYGIDGRVLMENAGIAASRTVMDLLRKSKGNRVCIVAGTGNNGGDGFVVARQLATAGVGIDVLICGDRERIRGDALSNLTIIENMSLPLVYIGADHLESAADHVRRYGGSADVVVDGLLGTGAAGAPREPVRTVIETLNGLGKPIVALDIPSGLDCDTGEPLEIAVRASRTVTFAAMKKGFQNTQSRAYTGQVTVASIGIHTSLLMPHS